MSATSAVESREWFARLEGDPTDLTLLFESGSNAGVRVRIDESGAFLHSSQFQHLNDADAVRDRADVLVRFMSGACRLGLGAQRAIRVACIHRTRLDGVPADTFLRVGPATISARVIPPTIVSTSPDGQPKISRPGDRIARWLDLAGSDRAAATLLRLLDTSSPDFVDLYRILDLIQDNVGASNVSERGWCSTRAISRFTQTANSPTAIGDAARHGREHSHPPSRPMTLAEARRLIFGLAEHWLDWRADEPQEQ